MTATTAPSTPSRSLWPKEHGAYMELLFPLAAALVLGEPSPASFALALAALALFFAHEPLALLLGRRGARRRAEGAPAAARRLGLWLVLALGLGLFGLLEAGPLTALLAAPPAALGFFAFALLARGKERNLVGESVVAITLTSASIPVATSAGVLPIDALTHAAIWALCFVLGTFAARGALIRKKDNGRGLGAGAALALICGAVAVASLAFHQIDSRLAFAPVPFAVVALFAALRPPKPKQMTRVGFALTGAACATLAWLSLA